MADIFVSVLGDLRFLVDSERDILGQGERPDGPG